MVKSYLRYEPAVAFGVIVSTESNITYDSSGKYLLSPALEKIAVWHVRQGICSKSLSSVDSSGSPSSALTSIAHSPTSLVAGGHADGRIRIWDIDKGICEVTLNGHKSAVSALRYNKAGSLLGSGSKDCDIILWDAVSENGLFRLRGHRDQVTDLVFLECGKKLVSSSKDRFLRVWDLETQHCIQILGGHQSEIWSIDIDPYEKYLVSGSADQEIRFYNTSRISDDSGIDSSRKREILNHFGEIQRQSKDRVSKIRFNNGGTLLACQVSGKTVDVFRVLSDTESKQKAKRRIRRKREKKTTKVEVGVTENDHPCDETGKETEETIVASDVFRLLQIVRCSKKICSISFCPVTPKGSLATLAVSLNNNSLEFYSIEMNHTEKLFSIDLEGHRSDIRSVTLSSDNTLLMSTSHNAVKIWNPSTSSCLRTIDSGFGLCSLFCPGNRFACVGTKGGKIEIIDVGSSTRVEVVDAHSDSVQSMALFPDGGGFVTGSMDGHLKFWEFRVSHKPGQDLKNLTVSNIGDEDMNNGVSAVSVSPNAKYVAVALLDCTVKVIFMDSHKLFLSLYGHKLPVLCMDISSDGDLIATGSSDKNLKIWGLDFGDCHKSIFAHSESVTALHFVSKTHYLFSVGKDRVVKYWDADKFELLLTLAGHHAEVWCLDVSNRGDFIVTGSHDRSIRRWDRTEEPFFLEEEKEKRLEEMFESDIDTSFEHKYDTNEVPEEGDVSVTGKRTQETLTAADTIMNALDMAEAELKRIADHEEDKANKRKNVDFRPNILMLGLSASDYVLHRVSSVKANDLEHTLLALPFSDALKLMSFLKDWVGRPETVELVCRMSTIIVQTYHNQMISTPSTKPLLMALRDLLQSRVKEYKDVIGFNLAAMEHLKQLTALRSDSIFRDAKKKLVQIRESQSKHKDAEIPLRLGKKKRKRKQSL